MSGRIGLRSSRRSWSVHSVDAETAFEMLRSHSRDTNRKLIDVASAVVDGHRLLPRSTGAP
jgi:hypothetical protein